MKALRYLLILVAVMGVLSLSAQTPKYGKPYRPSNGTFYNPQAQMPVAAMGSVDAEFMQSGSNLPMAAQSGVVTTYDKSYLPNRPRRAADGDDDDTPPSDPHGPMEDPLGDALWPLMVCALAYLIIRVVRKRARA